MPHLKFELGKYLDPNLLDRVESVFDGENVVELILHAHLLIERALTSRIAEKLTRPQILEQFSWSFHQKISLYVGLYDPTTENEELLRGFNRVRNGIAHDFADIEKLVNRHLPWRGESARGVPSPAPDVLSRLSGTAMIILFVLGGLRAVRRTDFDLPSTDSN
jgi:hypothetical protein